MKALFWALLLIPSFAPAEGVVPEFIEEKTHPAKESAAYQKYKAAAREQFVVMGSARQNYRQFVNRVRIPGFMSSSPIPEIAKIVGPANLTASYRIGDRLYLYWLGSPAPKVGDRYSTYTPAKILQSLLDPTEFTIKLRPEGKQKNPENFRMAGYFYESTGTVKIAKVSQGVVEAVIEGLSGQIAMSDRLMPLLPMKTNITPYYGSTQLAAAVVAGSPVERLSTTKRSFIYLNRGTRDGVREGMIFQAIETVRLDSSIAGPAPEVSAGEAMVVHASDAYSTAIITEQFDVIRIGSLLKAKQPNSNVSSKEPFSDLFMKQEKEMSMPQEELVPNVDAPDFQPDPTLPDPLRQSRPQAPAMSELDALEKQMNFENLSAEERNRLGKLSKQEKIGQEDKEEDAPIPSPLNNSFQKDKAKKVDKKKRVLKPNDEEELNQLMMQN